MSAGELDWEVYRCGQESLTHRDPLRSHADCLSELSTRDTEEGNICLMTSVPQVIGGAQKEMAQNKVLWHAELKKKPQGLSDLPYPGCQIPCPKAQDKVVLQSSLSHLSPNLPKKKTVTFSPSLECSLTVPISQEERLKFINTLGQTLVKNHCLLCGPNGLCPRPLLCSSSP